jgi:Zn-dependent protease with chaperone function
MKFKCECGQTLATDDSAVGMTVECPSCNRRLKVPAADAPNVIRPPAVVAAPSSPPATFSAIQSTTPPLSQVDATTDLATEEGSVVSVLPAGTADGGPAALLVSVGEKKAFRVLVVASIPALIVLLVLSVVTFGVFLLVIGLVALFGWLAGQFAAAHIRANAVRVTEGQLPELHKIVTTFAAMAGKPAPEVYVMQASAWNAMAMRFAGTRMVVLLSGAVDSLLLKGDMRQLAWLVGHELGHHFAGHLDTKRRFFVSTCMLFPLVVFWYQRQCELTCDRYGLACAGSAMAAMRALANMAAGAQLGPRVDAAAAVEQWVQCRRSFFVRLRALYSTHPHVLCRIAETAASARELNVPA